MKGKPTTAQRYKKEGRCASCGEFSYPYYQCSKCRIRQNIFRVLASLERAGWVDVFRVDGKKAYKWNNTAPERIRRKGTPESLAKLALPRLKGKPMTDKVMEGAIMEVIHSNGFPMTEKEIHKGIRSLKTIGHVVLEKEGIIQEYRRIQSKQSPLSRSQREAVIARVKIMLKLGSLQESDLTNA